jgi:membrane protease YdiL (CAAX protease family)
MPWHTPAAALPSAQDLPNDDAPWHNTTPSTPRSRELGPRVVGLGVGLAIVGLLVIQGVAFGIVGFDTDDRTELTTALIATFIADIATLIAIPYLLLGGSRSIWRNEVWSRLGLRRPQLSTVAWALAAVGLAYVGLGIYLVLVNVLNLDALEPVSTIDDDVIYDHVELVVLVTILAVVIAPITEEIFYRGFMFGGFAKRWGVPAAALLSGLIFAVAHIDVGSIIPFTIIGVVFALVYYRSRNLFSAWGAHVLFNAIAIVGTIADRGVG